MNSEIIPENRKTITSFPWGHSVHLCAVQNRNLFNDVFEHVLQGNGSWEDWVKHLILSYRAETMRQSALMVPAITYLAYLSIIQTISNPKHLERKHLDCDQIDLIYLKTINIITQSPVHLHTVRKIITYDYLKSSLKNNIAREWEMQNNAVERFPQLLPNNGIERKKGFAKGWYYVKNQRTSLNWAELYNDPRGFSWSLRLSPSLPTWSERYQGIDIYHLFEEELAKSKRDMRRVDILTENGNITPFAQAQKLSLAPLP